MKIKKLVDKDAQEIKLSKFTVLVGPNNVGKSQTLRDIYTLMTQGKRSRTEIINDINFEEISDFKEFIKGLKVDEDPQNIGYKIIKGIQSDLKGPNQVSINLDGLKEAFERERNIQNVVNSLGRFFVLFLDASSRLLVAQKAPSFNPHRVAPGNLLQALFIAPHAIHQSLTGIFKKVFDMEILLDISGMMELTLRVAKKFESIPENPIKAYPIMTKYEELDTQGDGFRSFIGVVLSLLLSGERIILLDEPEAFLHPAQAKLLGYWIAEYSRKVRSQIIVATHNANFLSGILSSTQKVDIFRLNRKDDHTSYNLISSDATSKLAKSPLLSSQRVLEAIFHKGVIVCEGDADRSVYHTVATKEFDNENVLFIHAHSKQTIKDVIVLLKEATIPACAITDIDILTYESDFENLLKALTVCKIPKDILLMRNRIAMSIEGRAEAMILNHIREEIQKFLEQLIKNEHSLSGAKGALNRISREFSKWTDIKKNGIKAVPKEGQKTAKDLIERAKECGLFIVTVGELEGWLDVGTRQKNKWVVLALEALHQNKCSTILKDFVGEILRHIGEAV